MKKIYVCILVLFSLCFVTGCSNAVKESTELIDALTVAPITLESGDDIAAARAAYDSLKMDQQKKITNYEILVSAEKVFEAMRLINSLTELPITLESVDAIATARKAYDALSEEEKTKVIKVIGYDILESAEKVYTVEKYIDWIGELTGEPKTGASIAVAEKWYNALNESEKAKVKNYDYLVEAKEKYPALKEQLEREQQQEFEEACKTAIYKMNSSVGGASNKCVMCNGTGYVRYNYGSSDLEAYLTGHDPYTVGKCTSCGGTGRG